MKLFGGYIKRKLEDTNLLLAGGGHKSLGDFIGSLQWDDLNRKLQYKSASATTWTDLVAFGSNAMSSTSYLPLTGGTITNGSNWAAINFSRTGVGSGTVGGIDANGLYFMHQDSAGTSSISMYLKAGDGLKVDGTKVSLEGHTHDYATNSTSSEYTKYIKCSGVLGTSDDYNSVEDGLWTLVNAYRPANTPGSDNDIMLQLSSNGLGRQDKFQINMSANLQRMYFRRRYNTNDGWSSWQTIAWLSDLSDYVPKSGNSTISGILTIAPSNVSAYLDALVLYDNGGGASEGCRIRFTSGSYTDGIALGPNTDKTNLLINDSYSLIHSGNISSLSVSYADSAGSSSTSSYASYAGYINGTNDAASPGGALLRSGAGRADNATGDTWIYYDSLGGTSTPWGIKHDQPNNNILFYGAGNIRTTIHLGESKITATTFDGNATTATTATNLTNNPQLLIGSGNDVNKVAVKAGEKTSSYITVPYSSVAGVTSSINSNSVAASFVHKDINSVWSSYVFHVILLVAVQPTADSAAYNFINGRFFLFKTGGNVYDVVDVNINLVWNTLEYNITCYGLNGTYSLCRCKYNNVWYYALKCPYHANPFTNMIFSGYARSDWDSNSLGLPKDIGYYTAAYGNNAAVVNNAEVYNSISDTLTTSVVTGVYNRAVIFTAGIVGNASTASNVAWSGITSKPNAVGDSTHPVYWTGSGFTQANAYPTKSSWNYDDVYLKLSGGTMTGTPYINMPASAYSIADNQPFGITYGKILCYGDLKIAADTDGSTTEYIILTSGRGMGAATKANGLAVGYNSLTWKDNNVLHAGNSFVSKSGETLSVKINDSTLSLTNTWRGIQNNLTSDSTTDSLSAALGKLLNTDILSRQKVTPSSLGSYPDYYRVVIALCNTWGANNAGDSYSVGDLIYHRSNGLMLTYSARVNFNASYGLNYGANCSISSELINYSTAAVYGSGFRPCTFTYNGNHYAGIEFYFTQAHYWTFHGTTNFGIFTVAYFTHNGNSVLNSEIYNSLSYSNNTIESHYFYAIRGTNIYGAGFLKDGSSDDYLLSGGGGHKHVTQLVRTNTASSFASLDITRTFIYINGNIGSYSDANRKISVSAAMVVGQVLTVLAYNTGSSTTLALYDSNYSSLDGSTINCPSGKFLEISILCYDSGKYLISCKSQ